jgi:hypothetical protein
MLMVVQPRSVLLSILLLAPLLLSAEEQPDAREILRNVRVAQAAENRALTGRIRNGPRKVPFKLTMQKGSVRWDFQDPPQTLVLRLGEKTSSLEEVTADGKTKVSGSKFDDAVRGSDITFEDLAMRFLYWQDAEVEGEQTIALTKCWKLMVKPPTAAASTYSQVRIWSAKNTGALMKCEAFAPDGKLARIFTVVSGQKSRDGLWMLKQMRIEGVASRSSGDREPTYIEIDSDR